MREFRIQFHHFEKLSNTFAPFLGVQIKILRKGPLNSRADALARVQGKFWALKGNLHFFQVVC